MNISVGCIVEGRGDAVAVPILLRRLQQQLAPSVFLEVPQAIRTPRQKVIKPGELERAVELAARQVQRPCAIWRRTGQSRVRGVVPGVARLVEGEARAACS